MQVTQDLEPCAYSVSGSYSQLLSLGNVHGDKDVHTLKSTWEGLLPCLRYIVLACGFSASLCVSVFLSLLTAPSAFSLFLASSTLLAISAITAVFFQSKDAGEGTGCA